MAVFTRELAYLSDQRWVRFRPHGWCLAHLFYSTNRDIGVPPRRSGFTASKKSCYPDGLLLLSPGTTTAGHLRVIVIILRDVLGDALDETAQPSQLLLHQGHIGQYEDGLAGWVLDDLLEHQDVCYEGFPTSSRGGIDQVLLTGEKAPPQ